MSKNRSNTKKGLAARRQKAQEESKRQREINRMLRNNNGFENKDVDLTDDRYFGEEQERIYGDD